MIVHSLLGILIVGCLLIFGLAYLNETQASRIRAEAQAESMIIRAQAESRLTSAQASAITMAAAAPMVLIVVGGFIGSILAVALLVFAFRYWPSQPQIIERQVIYLPAPGLSRRQVWQALGQGEAGRLVIVSGERKYHD